MAKKPKKDRKKPVGDFYELPAHAEEDPEETDATTTAQDAEIDAIIAAEGAVDWGEDLLDTGTSTDLPPPVRATTWATPKSSKYVKCAYSHPLLDIAEDLPAVAGGACGNPIVNDYDVYIGFDASMRLTSRQFPWTKGHEIEYLITDRAAPKHAPSFIKMIDWTLEQMKAGAKVHAGCIGGHGRTGLFLAALYAKANPDKALEAIDYVREHYCKKAVETKEQIDFLAEHFGCDKKAKGSKAPLKPLSPYKGSSNWPKSKSPKQDKVFGRNDRDVRPMVNRGNVWGKTIDDEDGIPY